MLYHVGESKANSLSRVRYFGVARRLSNGQGVLPQLQLRRLSEGKPSAVLKTENSSHSILQGSTSQFSLFVLPIMVPKTCTHR